MLRKSSLYCRLSCRLQQGALLAYIIKSSKLRSILLSYFIKVSNYQIRRMPSVIIVRRRLKLLLIYSPQILQGSLIGILQVQIQIGWGFLLIFSLGLVVLQSLLVVYQVSKGFLYIVSVIIAFLFNQVFSISIVCSKINDFLNFLFFFIILKFNLYFKLYIG